MGERGVLCAPHCRDGSLDCPADVPSGAAARPQCILQDVDRSSFCGLVCTYDSDCAGTAYCHRLAPEDGGTDSVGICMYPLSFADWAKSSQRTKLKLAPRSSSAPPGLSYGIPGMTIAPPVPSNGFQVAKAYNALQNLKRRFNIQDGDQDVLSMKELLSAVSVDTAQKGGVLPPTAAPSFGSPPAPPVAPAVLAAPAPPAPNAGRKPGAMDKWEHDFSYFTSNMQRGVVPGLEKEIQDTVWNVEHIHQHGASSTLLRGIIWIALIYLGIGVTYKHQVLGARGLDMIPHVGFWMEFPGLVVDGMRYSAMAVSEIVGNGGLESRNSGFQPMGGSARDTFTYFEPSK
eukprot:CAMPEP_0178415698 /NCGR_PEP_ID=MMETSP0689_2-20121128/23684_1 /TAXON_ID=160604 /ORGANISM="Amphidinium massartii, Strain CS-259" /LENGTH=343 /DNA_ID=CAMNT_0020037023 /DNA_START=179 /DNA_END=1210 /DNA_ORIENTATION=-